MADERITRIVCACGKTLKAPLSHAGKDVKCPHCGRVQTLPPEPVISSVPPETPPPANDSLETLASSARRLPVKEGHFICPNPKCDFVGRAIERGDWSSLHLALGLIIIAAVLILTPMFVQTIRIEEQRIAAARELARAMKEAKRELEKISKEVSAPVNYGQIHRSPIDVAMGGYNLIVWSILVVGAAICMMLSVRETEYKCPQCGMRL